MIDYGVTYKVTGDLNLIGYVNSDFAGCKDTWRSTKGNIFLVVGGPISWESKKQETVALLTVEAEYMAFSRATTQALWISKYLCEIELLLSRPITIYADNKGSITHCLNDKNHRRTKHIDIRHHFVKDQVNFEYIPIANNIADLFTKPLACNKVLFFTSQLNLPQVYQVDQSRGSIGQNWSHRDIIFLSFFIINLKH